MRDDVVRGSQVAWINGCPVVSDISDHLGVRVESESTSSVAAMEIVSVWFLRSFETVKRICDTSLGSLMAFNFVCR